MLSKGAYKIIFSLTSIYNIVYSLVPEDLRTDQANLIFNGLGLSVPQVGKISMTGAIVDPNIPNTWFKPVLLIDKNLILFTMTKSMHYKLEEPFDIKNAFIEFSGEKYKISEVDGKGPLWLLEAEVKPLATNIVFFVARLNKSVEGIVPFRLATSKLAINTKVLIASFGTQVVDNKVVHYNLARAGVGMVTEIGIFEDRYIGTQFCKNNCYSAALVPLFYSSSNAALFLPNPEGYAPILYAASLCRNGENLEVNNGSSIFIDIKALNIPQAIKHFHG